ncbi:DUF6461 domain-containing protein [Actinomadura rupiterrae]|uniref:DUF6461 domain-containing protein n=1 Tax=Actinomadura rupiterrae TaxID=559627 RepID=UPI0020A40B95|nr:DUF6461 domain-containing protein [Actinomadura rupiterrae]MCP2342268.1 hypothetical protein [Actinomadura rupiterrae]
MGSLNELDDSFADEPQVALRSIGDWVLAIEFNGYQGKRPEVLRRATETSRAVCVYWCLGEARFSYAVEGAVWTTFDALWPDRRFGTSPDCLQAEMADLPWDDPQHTTALSELASRVTGQSPDRTWLQGDFLIVPIQEWEEDLPADIRPDLAALTYSEPAIAYALRHAAPERLRRTARAAAGHAARAFGLADHPLVDAALHRQPTALGALVRGLRDAARDQGGGPAWAPAMAVEAVRHACGPDPLASAFGAVEKARSACQYAHHDVAELRVAVLAALDDPTPPAGANGARAADTGTPVERYAWIERHWLGPGAAVVYVRTDDVEGVARALGGALDRASTGPAVLAADQWALRTAGGWVIAVGFGDGGLGPQVALQAFSAGTTAVAAIWSARGNSIFYRFVDGQACTVFRALRPRDASGTEPDALLEEVTDLGLPLDGGPAAQAPGLLALAERVTGVGLRPEALDGTHWLVAASGSRV